MALTCASTVDLCAVRATRLASDGTVDPNEDNSYVVSDVIQLQVNSNTREGEDRELIGGCGGCPIATKTDDDQFRRFDLELQNGRLEPGLLEMLTGATVINGTDGPLGVQLGEKTQCGTTRARVAFEAWSKRWTEDDEQDPIYPWWHFIFPSVLWVLGQNTLSADFGPITLTGKTRTNSAWGEGPYGDMLAAIGGAQLAIEAYAGDPPTGTCNYSTVT